MFITTYYSYKGGVGRTMALANVALLLARAGRKVLLVDFDIEAPGLETFEALQPPTPVDGVVEFVCSYQATGEAPDVSNYVFERSDCAANGGRLWIMAAGRRDRSYETRLASINWSQLYAERDGYLLLEDLKEQWRKVYAPDYVLIDSRTGHTDVGGICTRQLPDVVVIFFFPNNQNLLGLISVVEDIRAESLSGRRKPIELLFVASNVPALDDEDRILEERLSDFRRSLGYGNSSVIIHHYPSLALLKQAIFATERPRSNLAEEYRKLQLEIVKRNPQDRVGALEYLREAIYTSSPASEADARIDAIKAAHQNDGEVLFKIAHVEVARGHLDDGLALLSQAELAGWQTPELFRYRLSLVPALLKEPAELRRQITADARAILAQGNVTSGDLSIAMRYLMNVDPTAGRDSLTQSAAYRSLTLEKRAELVGNFLSAADASVMVRIVEDVLSTPGAVEQLREKALTTFGLGLVATGHFREAKEFFDPSRPSKGPSIVNKFNFAMAEWGASGQPSKDLLASVAALDRSDRLRNEINYKQCMALAYWAEGNTPAAEEFLNEAMQEIDRSTHRQTFSCWRYLNVGPDEFREDLRSIGRLIRGEPVAPAFMRYNKADK